MQNYYRRDETDRLNEQRNGKRTSENKGYEEGKEGVDDIEK